MGESGDSVFNESISNALANTLNRHGHSFQYAVIKRIYDLFKIKKSHWIFQVAEFPVVVQDRDAKIDFILQRIMGSDQFPLPHPIFLVAECKRANPALKDWLFAKAPFIQRNGDSKEKVFELFWKSESADIFTRVVSAWGDADSYDIGFERKGKEIGDKKDKDSGRKAIDEATSQVCRGFNGLIEYLAQNRVLIRPGNSVFVVPAIFTTADLWVSDVDLSKADLKNGEIDKKDVDAKKTKWLWFRYAQSESLKHTLQSEIGEGLSETLTKRYLRSIAIVNSAGIEDFLSSSWSSSLRWSGQ